MFSCKGFRVWANALQRYTRDSSRRVNELDNLNVDGTVKIGRLVWNTSHRYQQLVREKDYRFLRDLLS